MGDGRAYHLDM